MTGFNFYKYAKDETRGYFVMNDDEKHDLGMFAGYLLFMKAVYI